jgi:hypothetical protein
MLQILSLHYPPFGSSLPNRSWSDANRGYRFGYQNSENEAEMTNSKSRIINTFYRIGDTQIGIWWSKEEKKPNPSEGLYVLMSRNPILYNDIWGDSVWLYSTSLPGAPDNWFSNQATHTFIVVKTDANDIKYYAYGPNSDNPGVSGAFGGFTLTKVTYNQDIDVYKGKDTKHLKAKILIDPPAGTSSTDFDKSVNNVANSFGCRAEIKYNAMSDSDVTGNCNSSTSTILSKAGITKDNLNKIEGKLPGLNWGFGDIKPWTAQEQSEAIEKAKEKTKIDEKFIDSGSKH